MSELEKIIAELKGKKIAGIYKITSPSGRIYIGSSIDLAQRFNTYKLLKCKRQPKLYNSFIKYGVDVHTFEVVEFISNDNKVILNSSLDDREVFIGLQLRALDECNLNLSLGRRSPIVSEETKRKVSAGHINKGIGNKVVYQYSLSGEFIQEWKSAKSAGIFLGYYSGSNIGVSCGKENVAVGGFV